jgi:hypothetical protein
MSQNNKKEVYLRKFGASPEKRQKFILRNSELDIPDDNTNIKSSPKKLKLAASKLDSKAGMYLKITPRDNVGGVGDDFLNDSSSESQS